MFHDVIVFIDFSWGNTQPEMPDLMQVMDFISLMQVCDQVASSLLLGMLLKQFASSLW